MAHTVDQETRLRISEEACALVRNEFAHWAGTPDLDFETHCAAYRGRAAETSGRREFGLLTLEFFSALRNGHTDFGDSWLWQTYGGAIGFSARLVEGRWVVTRSERESPIVGDVIVAIDGQPFEAFVQEQVRYVPSSSEREAFRKLFGRSYLFPERFTLTLEDGKEVVIDRSTPPAPAATAAPAATSYGRWITPDQIAYIRIPSFGQPHFETAALDLVRQYRGAEALIVDVRGNGGGDTPWQLRKALMNGSYRNWKIERQQPGATPGLLFRIIAPVYVALKRVPSYRGKVVFLVDGGCMSACEDLVVSFKDNGRAVLVGDTTMGSTGQPVFRRFENGMSFRVSARRVTFPDGSPFEGRGIAPDHVVLPTREDLRARRDVAMEEALTLLRN